MEQSINRPEGSDSALSAIPEAPGRCRLTYLSVTLSSPQGFLNTRNAYLRTTNGSIRPESHPDSKENQSPLKEHRIAPLKKALATTLLLIHKRLIGLSATGLCASPAALSPHNSCASSRPLRREKPETVFLADCQLIAAFGPHCRRLRLTIRAPKLNRARVAGSGTAVSLTLSKSTSTSSPVGSAGMRASNLICRGSPTRAACIGS